MSRPYLCHIATHGSGISPATLNHVLGLVQRSLHTEPPVARKLTAERRIGKFGDHRRDVVLPLNAATSNQYAPPLARIRHYSSHAHAIEPESSNSAFHPPHHSCTSPPTRSSSSLIKSLRLGNFESAVRFRAAFDQLNLRSTDLKNGLADLHRLWVDTATKADWAWMEGHMVILCREIRNMTGKAVKDELAIAGSLMGVAQAKQSKWDDARRSIGRAVRTLLKQPESGATRIVTDCLKGYFELIKLSRRASDLVTMFKESGTRLRTLLISQRFAQPKHPEICDIFNDAFTSITEPETWLAKELDHEDLVDHKTRKLGLAVFAALIRESRRSFDAILVYELLTTAGTFPSLEDTSLYLDHLVRTGSHSRAVQTYEELKVRYPVPNHAVLTRALAMYGSAGKLDEAKQVYLDIQERSKPTKGDVLTYAKCFANLGQVDETREVLASPIIRLEDDYDALSVLLTAHLTARETIAAELCLGQMMLLKRSIKPFNRILTHYARTVNVDAAVDIFDRILQNGLEPDKVSYTALISLFGNRRDATNARNIFQAMSDSGIEPDAIASAAVLNAEIESGGWLEASERWAEFPDKIKYDANVLTTTLKAFVLLGSPLGTTTEMFRKIPNPNSRAWALIIQSASDSGDLALARDLYEEMDRAASKSPVAPAPNVYIFTILLHGYLRLGDGDSARSVYEEMQSRKLVPSSVTYGVIIRSFATIDGGHSITQAQEMAMSILQDSGQGRLAESPKSRGKTKENLMGPLVTSSSAIGRIGAAQSYFDAATETEKPSISMYTKLMDAYRRAGDVETVLAIWDKVYSTALASTTSRANALSSGASIKPARSQSNILCIPLSIALDALSAVGRFFDVQKVWTQVHQAGFGFDSQNYNHYATALARTGNLEGAFNIVENILLPRHDEVTTRRTVSVRDEEELKPLPSVISSEGNVADVIPGVADLPVEPPMRPPNRRHENREDLSQQLQESRSYDGDSRQDSKFSNLTSASEWLKFWRPNDTTWHPSVLTIAVLEHAYTQLQSKRGVWIGVGSDEGEADAEVEGVELDVEASGSPGHMVLPDFGGITVKDSKGNSSRSTPAVFLARLNSKYARAVALVMLHRKKRARKAEKEK